MKLDANIFFRPISRNKFNFRVVEMSIAVAVAVAAFGDVTIGLNVAIGIGVDLGEVGASVLFRGHGQSDGNCCHG